MQRAALPKKQKSAARFAAAASAALLFILVFIAISPKRYADACLEGLKTWLLFVLPSLFPFFVFTSLLTKLGFASKASGKLSPLMEKGFRLPGTAAYCFLMSAISGYPVGSRVTCDLAENGLLERKNATFAGALCSTSGPMFVIGSVGAAMFRSAAFRSRRLRRRTVRVTPDGRHHRFLHRGAFPQKGERTPRPAALAECGQRPLRKRLRGRRIHFVRGRVHRPLLCTFGNAVGGKTARTARVAV